MCLQGLNLSWALSTAQHQLLNHSTSLPTKSSSQGLLAAITKFRANSSGSGSSSSSNTVPVLQNSISSTSNSSSYSRRQATSTASTSQRNSSSSSSSQPTATTSSTTFTSESSRIRSTSPTSCSTSSALPKADHSFHQQYTRPIASTLLQHYSPGTNPLNHLSHLNRSMSSRHAAPPLHHVSASLWPWGSGARFTNPWPTWTGDKAFKDVIAFSREMRGMNVGDMGYLSYKRNPTEEDFRWVGCWGFRWGRGFLQFAEGKGRWRRGKFKP